MFEFIKDLKKLRELRKIRSQLKEIKENASPSNFPYSLIENSNIFTGKDDVNKGEDIVNYINDVMHGNQSPIRDIVLSGYSDEERITISLNFWCVMEEWCKKNKDYCRNKLNVNSSKKQLSEREKELLNDLKI